MVCFSTNRFLLCLGKSCLYPSAKMQNFIEIQSNIIELHPKSPIFLGSSADFRTPCRNLLNCSLNHSPNGCLFIVSISLLSSVGFFSTLKISFVMSNFCLCSSEKYGDPKDCVENFQHDYVNDDSSKKWKLYFFSYSNFGI